LTLAGSIRVPSGGTWIVEFPRALVAVIVVGYCMLATASAWADGTAAGTSIDNVATVNFELGGVPTTLDSNVVTFQVLERLDVLVTLQSPQTAVVPSQTDAPLLFTVTNIGNGNGEFELFIDSALAGDDFDPVPAVPAIYFDTDASGDLSVGDIPYAIGANNPVLDADESVDIILANNIPGGLANGVLGRSALIASSTIGTGAPGDTFAGLGDGGVDAIVGASGATANVFGEYVVSDIGIDMTKSVTVADPIGGTEPTVGATLTYTITTVVTSAGTASSSVFSDVIPAFTTFVPNSIFLNGNNLTDGVDGDVAELDTSGAPTVVVRLGDLTLADGIQTIEFQVTID